jgi:hypothetical protein
VVAVGVMAWVMVIGVIQASRKPPEHERIVRQSDRDGFGEFAGQRSNDIPAEIRRLRALRTGDSMALALHMEWFCASLTLSRPAEHDAPERGGTLFGMGFDVNDSRAARALYYKALARCGGSMERSFLPTGATSIFASVDAPSNLGASGLSGLEAGDLTSPLQVNAVNNHTPSNATLVSIWSVENSSQVAELAANRGHLAGVDARQSSAVVWLAICDLGADCSESGIARITACIRGGICGGDSVSEGVAESISFDKLAAVRMRADLLRLEIDDIGKISVSH